MESMVKLATITPINYITHEQDGEIFVVYWDRETGELHACFDGGRQEVIDYTAQTLDEAVDIVHSLYARSIAFVYEAEEVEVDG